MKSNPNKALKVLENVLGGAKPLDKYDLWEAVAEAIGLLRGYELTPEVLDSYHCTFCGVNGVKLWRAIHSAQEAWCCRCGTAQAGLPDNADDNGRIPTEYSSRIDGRTDQIYSSKKGSNLLPWVPAPDGETWGYTSVPPEGCLWWKTLPTRTTSS